MRFWPRALAIVVASLVAGACQQCAAPEAAPTPEVIAPAANAPPAAPTPTPVVLPAATPTSVPFDVEATLRQSGQVMADLTSFHFQLRHESGSLQLLPGLAIDDAQADVVNPDKISIEFSGTFGQSFAIKSSLIAIGDDSYMTNPINGKWEAVPTDVSPLGFFSPTRGISAMMAEVRQVRLLDGDTGDSDVFRMSGTAPAQALAPLVGPTLEDATVQLQLTIDADTQHLLEAVIEGRVAPTDADGVVRVITLSRFNEPLTIEPPI